MAKFFLCGGVAVALGGCAIQPVPSAGSSNCPPPLVQPQPGRPQIRAERVAGSADIAPIAVDARWSNYGGYLQRMLDVMQLQWERLLVESKIAIKSGSAVTVKFVMNSKGEIPKVVLLDTSAGDQATQACLSAVADRSPYQPWTGDMIAVLGHEQEMKFRFYYQ